MSRITSLFAILVLAIHFPWWILLPAVIVYLITFSGYEIVILAVLLDGYYGNAVSVPYYTLCASVLWLLVEYLAPYLQVKKGEKRDI